jgi:hypothetical protein
MATPKRLFTEAVVIGGILAKDPAEVDLSEHHVLSENYIRAYW